MTSIVIPASSVTRLRAVPAQKPEDDNRVQIRVPIGRIDQVADAAEVALIASGLPFYARGDLVVRLTKGAHQPGVRRDPTLPTLVAATQSMMFEALEAACVFMAYKAQRDGTFEEVRVPCPKALPAVYLDRIGRWCLPEVKGVAGVPVLHEDGSICMDGYDPNSKVVVCASGKWPVIPDNPTREQALAALAVPDALIAGFPFAEETDRSVMLAAMLSAVIRASLPTCPGFGFTAPVRGSGKSTLGDICGVLATGKPPAAIAWPAKEEEAEKRLGAVLLSGDPIIQFDNLEAPLRSAALNSAITQASVAIRMLGQSAMSRIETRALFLATGNNLVIQGDLNRRFLLCRLDPGVERPELRRFAFDPVTWATTHRIEIVTALLTIARWGALAPHDAAPLGNFAAWSRRVRDPLLALGLPDPCACLEALHREDPEREAALDLVREWCRMFRDVPTTVSEAIRGAQHDASLRDALDAVAGAPGGISAKRLGRYLLRIRGRLFGDLVVRQHRDLAGNCAAWAVES